LSLAGCFLSGSTGCCGSVANTLSVEPRFIEA
jgi:hypothetical protein